MKRKKGTDATEAAWLRRFGQDTHEEFRRALARRRWFEYLNVEDLEEKAYA